MKFIFLQYAFLHQPTPHLSILHAHAMHNVHNGHASRWRQVSDFRESKATTQPNALETVAVSAGVTLRGGSQTKAGPPRPRMPPGTVGQGTGATMTRDEFSRYVLQQVCVGVWRISGRWWGAVQDIGQCQ